MINRGGTHDAGPARRRTAARRDRTASQVGSPNRSRAAHSSSLPRGLRLFSASSTSSVVLLLFAALTVCAAPATAAPAPCDGAVSRAIVEALTNRMGSSVRVEVKELSSCAVDEAAAPIVATPAPGSRLGRPIRFAISERVNGPRRTERHAGEAVASVGVSGPFVRALNALARGDVFEAGDVDTAVGEIADGFVRPLPRAEAVVGARAARAIAAGEVVAVAAIVAVPLVKSGDRVRAVVRTPEIEVESVAVATQNGTLDQVIRVVNPETKRAIRARVVGDKEVEVVHDR